MNPVNANNAIEVAREVAARVKGGPPACEPKPECAWVSVYHPSGLQVKLPITERPLDYAAMFGNISAALAAGFLVAPAGLEVGEEKEEVGFVLLRTKVNTDKTETKVIDLYSSGTGLKYKLISVYLDTPEDAADFERASGVKVSSLQEFPGSTSPKRGDNPKSDRFIIKVKPFNVVLAPNPKYNPDETDPTKKKPERLFVRWADAKPVGATPAQPTGDGIPPREVLAGHFRSARSHSDYQAVCNEIKAACADGRLDEADRLWLRGHAQACLERNPAPQKQTA